MQQLFYILTMAQVFKIRKNKSQKEISLNQELRRRSPALVTQLITKRKLPAHHHSHKITQLEPLLKTKGSLHNVANQSSEVRLDNTQPIPFKSACLRENEGKNQGLPLVSIGCSSNQQKENRPASINEIKYPVIHKTNSSYLRTDKYEKYNSQSLIGQMTEGLNNLKLQKESETQIIKKNPATQKVSKMMLLKTTSRSKLAKIFVLKPFQEHQRVHETQIDQEESENTYHRTFRKGIVNKIFSHPKNSGFQKSKAVTEIKQTEEAAAMISKQSQKQTPVGLISPVIKKETSLHWANCSTIKEQQQSASSFISRQIFDELISPRQLYGTGPSFQDKIPLDRRMKMQSERMKKKFPLNFFK